MKELTEKQTRKQDEFKNEMLPHLDSLYNFGLRLTADPIDAEDLVQDTSVKAYRFFGSYERGTNAKAWLFRILKNSYINGYRKKTKIPNRSIIMRLPSFMKRSGRNIPSLPIWNAICIAR